MSFPGAADSCRTADAAKSSSPKFFRLDAERNISAAGLNLRLICDDARLRSICYQMPFRASTDMAAAGYY